MIRSQPGELSTHDKLSVVEASRPDRLLIFAIARVAFVRPRPPFVKLTVYQLSVCLQYHDGRAAQKTTSRHASGKTRGVFDDQPITAFACSAPRNEPRPFRG